MAFTYTTLKATIQDYVESTESTFVDNLDEIIRQTEDRILKEAQLPVFRKNCQGTTTADNQYLQQPADYLSPYSLAVINTDDSAYSYLIFKDVSFVRAAYPTVADTGLPKFYTTFDDDYWLLGPTPDAAYTVEIHYFYRPTSIVDSADGTSWLGTYEEATLLYGCLHESAVFLQYDQDIIDKYSVQYDRALAATKKLGEQYNKTDEHRSG
jgi:hypothetical protein